MEQQLAVVVDGGRIDWCQWCQSPLAKRLAASLMLRKLCPPREVVWRMDWEYASRCHRRYWCLILLREPCSPDEIR